MEVKVEESKINEALKTLRPFTGDYNVLVEATDSLMLTVTNGNQRCLAIVEAEVFESGWFVVELNEFYDINPVTMISCHNDTVNFDVYDCKAINVSNLEPFTCHGEFEPLVVIDGYLIGKVAHAMSTTTERLQHVLLRAKDGFMVAVACDGFRLAEAKVESTAEFEVLIPANIVPVLPGHRWALGIVEDTVILRCAELQIEFPKFIVNYPEYQKLFDFTPIASIEIESTNFQNWLQECGYRRSKRVIINCHETGATFLIDSHVLNFGYSSAGKAKIDIDSCYLYEAINAIEDGSFTVMFGGHCKPVEIRSTGLRQLIMPMSGGA